MTGAHTSRLTRLKLSLHKLRKPLGFRPLYLVRRGQQLRTVYMENGATPGPTDTTWEMWNVANPEDGYEWGSRTDEEAFTRARSAVNKNEGRVYLVDSNGLRRLGEIDASGSLVPVGRCTRRNLYRLLAWTSALVVGLVGVASGVTSMFGVTVPQLMQQWFGG